MLKPGVLLALFLLLLAPSLLFSAEEEGPGLSPLALALENLLLGDGGELRSDERNPFDLQIKRTRFQLAMDQLWESRREPIEELFKRGSQIKETYRRQLAQRSAELAAEHGLQLLAGSSLLTDWDLLLLGRKEGQRKLTLSENHLRALAMSYDQFPQATDAPREDGVQKRLADQIYYRNSLVVDLYERRPETRALTRAEFEAWRQSKVEGIIDSIRRNLLFQLGVCKKNGATLTATMARKVKVATEIVYFPVEWKDFEASLHPVDYTVGNTGELVFDNPGTGAVFTRNFPPLRLSYNLALIVMKNGPDSFSSNMLGSLDVERDALTHLSEVLHHGVLQSRELLSSLAAFRYETYRRDAGRQFWRKWAQEVDKALGLVRTRLETPNRNSSSGTSMNNLDPWAQAAFWGRYSDSPGYWDNKVREGKSLGAHWKTLEKLTTRSLWAMSAEIPLPVMERIKRAAIAVGKGLQSAWGWGTATAIVWGGVFWAGLDSIDLSPLPFPGVQRGGDTMPKSLSSVGTAFNKPLSGEQETYYILKTMIRDYEFPRRFAIGKASEALFSVDVPEEAPETEFTVHSKRRHDRIAEIPTADGAVLRSLYVYGSPLGTVWKPLVDYEVKQTFDGQVVVFPKRWGTFKVVAGFSVEEDDALPPVLTHPALRALDPKRLNNLIEDLEKNRFVLLPHLLRQASARAASLNDSLSVLDVESIFSNAAYYSQVKEKTQFGRVLRSEINRASRFLDEMGISCYQCDGAGELAVSSFRRLLPPESGVTVEPRTVIVREGVALSRTGLHRDFVVRAPGSPPLVLDTTPSTMDPRDTQGIPIGASIANRLPREEAPEGLNRKEAKRAYKKYVQRLRPPILWNLFFLEWVRQWESDSIPRKVPSPLVAKAVAAGGTGETGQKPQKPAEHEVVESQEVSDIAAPETQGLDARFADLEDEIAKVRARARKLGLVLRRSEKMPLLSLFRVRDILAGWLRGERDFSAFKGALQRYLPLDYEWLDANESEQVHHALGAVESHQAKALASLIQFIQRGGAPELRQMLDTALRESILAGYEKMATTPWYAVQQSCTAVLGAR